MKRLVLIFSMLLLAALACSLNPENLPIPEDLLDPDQIATRVAGTLQASGADPAAIATTIVQTLEASLEDLPLDQADPDDPFQTGTVEVSLCYPSEMIPAMTVYLENVNTQEVTVVPTVENQLPMSLPLPPGTYVAYAWLPGNNLGGSYSQAVPCGLSVACTDHSLIQFEVVSGQVTPGVEICDWYGAPGDVPLPPGN